MIGSISSPGSIPSARLFDHPPVPIRTVTPKAEIDASYKPAEMDIRTRNVEMDANWDAVWDELGYKRPSGFRQEISRQAQAEGQQAVSNRAAEGDRIGNIAKVKGNVFGQIAYERWARSGRADVELVALPKFGVRIDVRIYPPEISVHTKGVNG